VLYCSDDTRLEPQNIDEVVAFPNTGKRCLTGISVATEYSKRPRIGLRLNTSGYSSVSYEIDAEDIDFSYLDDKLTEWVDSVRQWYSVFAFSSPTTILISGLFVAVGVALMAIPSASPIRTRVSTGWALVSVLLGTSIIFLVWASKYLRKWLFPVGVFAIGQGKDRLHNLRTRQKNVSLVGLIGLILAFAFSVLASVIGNRITGK
jgi:hypothetical protein